MAHNKEMQEKKYIWRGKKGFESNEKRNSMRTMVSETGREENAMHRDLSAKLKCPRNKEITIERRG